MAPLARPLQVAVIDGERWVCMRSLIEGLGIAWLRWEAVFGMPMRLWQASAAEDNHGRPTWLMREPEASAWLMSATPLMSRRASAGSKTRLRALRQQWHALLQANGGGPAMAKASTRGRPRKINGGTIEQLFQAWQRTGNYKVAATEVGIPESTARRLAIYSYPNGTAEMLAAWQRTFGRQ